MVWQHIAKILWSTISAQCVCVVCSAIFTWIFTLCLPCYWENKNGTMLMKTRVLVDGEKQKMVSVRWEMGSPSAPQLKSCKPW